MPPEKQLLGMSPEKQLLGMSPEKQLLGMSPEKQLQLTACNGLLGTVGGDGSPVSHADTSTTGITTALAANTTG